MPNVKSLLLTANLIVELMLKAQPTCDWPVLSMDDLDVLEQAPKEPSSLLFGKTEVVIDEIQISAAAAVGDQTYSRSQS
ncbi:MAG: hypothetical protein ACE5IR_06500 [bacterium]